MQALYLNPNHVTRPVQVPHFNQVAQVDPKTDALTGYAVIADKKALADPTALIVNDGSDCSPNSRYCPSYPTNGHCCSKTSL